MGFKKWWKNEGVGKATSPLGPLAGAAPVFDALGIGEEKEDPNKQVNDTMKGGMAEGKALGESLMADPDLVKSRQGMRDNLALTGPNKDVLNQQASKQVANMRYKGSKMSHQQQLEAQRKLSSDIGAQKFTEDQEKAQGMYDMDLNKAKFIGGMSIGGAQMALAQMKEKKTGLDGMFESIGF